jgi:hypothetical protein
MITIVHIAPLFFWLVLNMGIFPLWVKEGKKEPSNEWIVLKNYFLNI